MNPHLQYAKYLTRHKWFVFRAGLKTGAPLWRLVIHDWSKLLPSEWNAYVKKFYGNWGTAQSLAEGDAIQARVNLDFDRAWLHHQHVNPHHWQHWVLMEDSGATLVLPMPTHFVREMVADWMGAGRAIVGKWGLTQQWYDLNSQHIVLHSYTRGLVQLLLEEYG